jgi:hypothetical protein
LAEHVTEIRSELRILGLDLEESFDVGLVLVCRLGLIGGQAVHAIPVRVWGRRFDVGPAVTEVAHALVNGEEGGGNTGAQGGRNRQLCLLSGHVELTLEQRNQPRNNRVGDRQLSRCLRLDLAVNDRAGAKSEF